MNLKPSRKASASQIRQHNRHLILRAIHSGLADNRAALANETGLTKPTVSDLITELIDEGLLIEAGRGKAAGSGGKRPRLLEFVPNARQVIGVSLTETGVNGLLTNLNGEVLAEHLLKFEDIPEALDIDCLLGVINGLIAQLDAPLLCLGLGVPGTVDPDTKEIHFVSHLGWPHIPLSEILYKQYDVPVYVGNNTRLAAIAQFAFETDSQATNLVTILINSTVEIGYVLKNTAYYGGHNIGWLSPVPDALPLDDLIGWSAIKRRVRQLKTEHPNNSLPEGRVTYLDIREGVTRTDVASQIVYEDIAESLAAIFSWVIALLRPDHICLAGGVADLGEPLLDDVRHRMKQWLPEDVIAQLQFSLATDTNLSARGSVAYALQQDIGLVQWLEA